MRRRRWRHMHRGRWWRNRRRRHWRRCDGQCCLRHRCNWLLPVRVGNLDCRIKRDKPKTRMERVRHARPRIDENIRLKVGRVGRGRRRCHFLLFLSFFLLLFGFRINELAEGVRHRIDDRVPACAFLCHLLSDREAQLEQFHGIRVIRYRLNLIHFL